MLITGGAGFMGSNFVIRTILTNKATRITVLDALTYAGDRASLASVASDIEFVHGSVGDAELVNRLVSAVDIVVHFAAESHNDNSVDDPFPFVETNLIGTYNLLESVRRHGVRMHHVSTDHVFGDLALDGAERFTEVRAFSPSSPYEATKAGSDLMVRAWIRAFRVQATISHSSNNYGPYHHVEKFLPRQITNVIDGVRPKIFGQGRNVRDWIHVYDHNSAVHAILERGTVGDTYLIGADCEASNIEMVQRILRLLGKPEDWLEYSGERPGHDLRYAVDASKIRSELGWRPEHTSIEDGLAQTVQWFVENQEWWRPKKEATELRYLRLGR